MVHALNQIGTNGACVGNHDLDFGVDQFRYLASQCNFPWLLANILDPALGEGVPIGNAQKTHIITSSNGIKIGLIGLGEREWLQTINSLPPNIIYKSASETAKELVPQLREQGVEIIIAITHQREPNDNKLAEKCPEGLIDIILGGHDHYYNHSYINGTHVLRSGSDFKQLSYIQAWRRQDSPQKWDFDIVRRDVISSIERDPETVELVSGLTDALKAKLDKPLGWTAAPLDARFTTVRRGESNYANFVCDIMRHHYQGDCCLMAAGTVRGDQVYPPGPIRVRDIMDCFPFEDPVMVIRVAGQAIWDALENAVSLYPALDGRFPQVSNITLEFDPSKPPTSRIVKVSIGNAPIDLEKKYVLVTRGYMARGKDGYDALLVESEGGSAEEIVSEENGILISMMLRQYFMSLKVVGAWKNWGMSMAQHWGEVARHMSVTHPVIEPTKSILTSPLAPAVERKEQAFGGSASPAESRMDFSAWKGWEPRVREFQAQCQPLEEAELDELRKKEQTEDEKDLERFEKEKAIMRKVMHKWCRIAGVEGKLCDSLKDGEFTVDWTKAICPTTEGRIKLVSSTA
ncbi:5'-nucleotidase [Eremomyces bilateralis CBS 781.70]|uniref:5'-nucleotidase n=1 Tax=Eremomyces bilateralis CBS 781.70 TaxID=1392243 RepID=A0A6G1G2T3_9PEZI|nr:5'-nucleotidase [Eremomyces bilateralis CBS 781.70]KAF1812353.1 5'-nucleotidase [Eremomyces bilateralis CBS 781.70]